MSVDCTKCIHEKICELWGKVESAATIKTAERRRSRDSSTSQGSHDGRSEIHMFENKNLAAWLEDSVRHIMEDHMDGIAIVAESRDGVFFKSYYNVGCSRKMEFASHIQVDAVHDVLEANGYIKEDDD